MCRDIIEAHQGRIRVESAPGRGTAFTLKLPTVTKAAARARPAIMPAKPHGQNLPGGPPVGTP
jgi:hypothetical protein